MTAHPKNPESSPSHTANPYTAALIIAFSAAFLLAGYEFARSPSNTLFKAAYGKEALPTVTAIMPLAVIAVLYVYNKMLSALGTRRTLLYSSLLAAASLFICAIAIEAGSKVATGVLFILKETYVVLIIEQYWSFLNSTLGSNVAKKMNGPICGISSIGAIIAGLTVGEIATSLGTNNMVLIAGALTIPAVFLADVAFKKCGEPKPHVAESHAKDQLGLSLFKSERILPLLIAAVVISQVVSVTLDFSFQGKLQDAIPDPDLQTAYSGRFFALLNLVALTMQFVISPLLLQRFRAGTVMLMIPVVHIITCSLYLFDPSLVAASAAFLLFKVLDYSIFRAAKELLYIPLSFDVRYRAKELIDVFGYRSSKGVTSLVISFFQKTGVVFTETHYTVIALAATGVWTAIAVPLKRLKR